MFWFKSQYYDTHKYWKKICGRYLRRDRAIKRVRVKITLHRCPKHWFWINGTVKRWNNLVISYGKWHPPTVPFQRFLFSPWNFFPPVKKKNDESARENLGLHVKKLQKVAVKNKRCPGKFSKIRNFRQFSQAKRRKYDLRLWNRKLSTREKFLESAREKLQVGVKKL